MAEKKEPVVKAIVKEGVKETVAAAGGVVGLAALIKKYIFPSNSPDASPGIEGLQADKTGRGMADEALFYEAVAEAAKRIEPADKDARDILIKKFFTAFNKLEPSVRRNAILCLGLSESKTTVTDKGGNVTTTLSNVRGINILESWLQLDAKTLKKVLAAPVQPLDIAKERIKNIDSVCAKINEEMVKIHGPLPVDNRTPDERRQCREERRKKIGTNPLSSLFSWRNK